MTVTPSAPFQTPSTPVNQVSQPGPGVANSVSSNAPYGADVASLSTEALDEQLTALSDALQASLASEQAGQPGADQVSAQSQTNPNQDNPNGDAQSGTSAGHDPNAAPAQPQSDPSSQADPSSDPSRTGSSTPDSTQTSGSVGDGSSSNG
jgi:hypothetical protein